MQQPEGNREHTLNAVRAEAHEQWRAHLRALLTVGTAPTAHDDDEAVVDSDARGDG